jgi:fructose-1,6-bisphosphatase
VLLRLLHNILLCFKGGAVKNGYLLGIALVLSVAIAGGYSYDYYRTSKLLDLTQFQAQQLVSDAINLRLYKVIHQAIREGKIHEVEKAILEHINLEQKRIGIEKGNYQLNENQLKTIDDALNET